MSKIAGMTDTEAYSGKLLSFASILSHLSGLSFATHKTQFCSGLDMMLPYMVQALKNFINTSPGKEKGCSTKMVVIK